MDILLPFVYFFAVVLDDYNVKLPETSQLHVLWRKCCMWSCSLSFRCRSFSAWWQLAFPLFLTAAIKVLGFSSNEIGLLWFLSFALALCLLSTSMQTLKFSRKKESAFVVVVFISKGWTYGLMYPVRRIFSEPKFLGCIDLPNFLTHGAPLHALR